jgi:Protein of unknwon function (DUF3310)
MGSDYDGILVGGGLMATPKKVIPNAVYEQFIDGRMRIMGSGADREWEDVLVEQELTALDKQEGGNHYKDMAIQPVEFITANDLGFLEGNIVKYVCRHHAKNGAEDIKKAIHYCELLLQTKYGG